MAGSLPNSIYSLVAPVVAEQEMIVEAALNRDLDLAFEAFMRDAHMPLPMKEAKELFDETVENTKEYLPGYKIRVWMKYYAKFVYKHYSRASRNLITASGKIY